MLVSISLYQLSKLLFTITYGKTSLIFHVMFHAPIISVVDAAGVTILD